MRKLIILVLLISIDITASNLREIRDVLKHVETNFNTEAIGDQGESFGILQIQYNAIKDVNKRYGTEYSHEDAFNEACADEIFELYVTMWTEHLECREGRPATEDDMVRIWNGGPKGYKKRATLTYLKRYREYKGKLLMNKRKCIVNGKLGVITGTYTYTMDVFIFKTRKTMYGIHRNFVNVLPEPKKKTTNQLALEL